MKKKVYEITILNVLFALLVMFIHISSNPVTVLEKTGLPYMVIMILWRLSSFVMQGFVFISGFRTFYNMKEDFSLGKFYLSKIKNVFLPYVLWVVVYYVYLFLRGVLPEENWFIAITRHVFVGDLVGHFYFIPLIMQFYLLIPLWKYATEKIRPNIAIILSFLIMIAFSTGLRSFIYNDRIFTTYLFYFVAGIYAGARYDKFIALLKKYFVPLVIIFAIAAISNAFLSYLNFTGRRMIYGLEYVHLVYCISAVFFCYEIALKCKRFSEKGLIKDIDRSSYYIYLVHPLFIFIIDKYMPYMQLYAVRFTYPVRILFVYTVTITISVAYTRFKNRKKT